MLLLSCFSANISAKAQGFYPLCDAHLQVDLLGVVGAPRPLHAAVQLASVLQEGQRARQACTLHCV